MRLMREEFPLQSTENGQIGWAVSFWLLLFLSVLLCGLMQVAVFRSSSRYMEDALAASNLAAAVIDVEVYGCSRCVRIGEVNQAREQYMTALKKNLGLNETWECANRKMITGPVRVTDFIIYNVDGNIVEIYSFDENGGCRSSESVLGEVTAPNGVLVEKTGIYSEITYQIKGVWNLNVAARKGKLVDVAKNL